MISIRYQRVPQAAHGVQSTKIRGGVSGHVSALHAWDEKNAQFGNLIVMQRNNEQIADLRLQLLNRDKIPAKLIYFFNGIQEYLNANHKLYATYKSIGEMERRMMKDEIHAEYIAKNDIKFRIVKTTDLNKEDLKNLMAHKGVYAFPERMPQDPGYVFVAYSFNRYDGSWIPFGVDVYPRNPKEPQRTISFFSDIVEHGGYVLLFPDGVGGYNIHKFRRHDFSKGEPLTWEQHVLEEVAAIRKRKENPEDYYSNITELLRSQQEKKSAEQQEDQDVDMEEDNEDASAEPIQNESENEMVSDEDDKKSSK